MSLSRILFWGVIAVIVLWAVNNPVSVGLILHNIGHFISHAGNSAGTAANTAVNGSSPLLQLVHARG